ncbi:MAG: translation initiation factor IF-2 [Bacilli bacterium]|nr:translation initiation factor IF-2 [Bacilli bacterium]
MMTVKDYAVDVKKSINEVLDKCIELGISAFNENDELTEENIIDLDNNLNFDEEEDIVEEIVEELANKKIDDTIKLEKFTKKDYSSTEDYSAKRKEMYKNKEKLISNIPNKQDNIIVYKEGMTLSSLAEQLQENPITLIKKFMSIGAMLNVNSLVSFEDAELVMVDYDKELKKEETQDESNFEKLEISDIKEDLEERPPVVTIMGHVDHGKTTLLDTIRKTNVVSGEVGGITQHIGAYQITFNNKKITFIDTPGHAAFTEMRARGASITDIVIIVVAADDGVMPQTKEAIDHAKAAKVPIIVAVNKIDKPNSNPEKVMKELSEYGLSPDIWGGDTSFVNVSALKGTGIDKLLENILLISEMEELKANKNRYALGTVVEANLDKNLGPSVTILVQNGTLRLGDPIVVGSTYGKVRTLKDDLGKSIVEALPSSPVKITGLNGMPTAGDKFMAFETDKQAKVIGETRNEKARFKSFHQDEKSIEDLFNAIDNNKKEINLIIKADVKGSEEAVKHSLEKINIEGIKINVVRSATGPITESDVILASATNSIIIGFNIKTSINTLEMAKEKKIEIKEYNIIYKVIEDLELSLKNMLDPIFEESITGHAEIKKLFTFSKVGTIAGCGVKDGIIKSSSKVRVKRKDDIIYDGNISAIQREKETVKEIKQGFDCGITLNNFNDLKEGDIIEAYEMVEVKRK